MTRTALRTTLISAGTAATLGIILVACGGGGGGSATPAAVTAPNPVASINPNQVNNNFTGPSAPMTISINLPPRNSSAAFRSKVRAVYGTLHSDTHIRMMSNTSPTASVRTLGLQQSRYALPVEEAARRSPQYVSPSISLLELVVSSGATVLVDDTAECTQYETCNATFLVPVGTYTVTLYVYDECTFLIAAGTQAGQQIVAGQNNPLTITLDPVVTYFWLTPSVNNVVQDPTANTTFTVTAEALDADYDDLTTPGVLLDGNFNQITGLNLSQDGSDVTPGSATVPLQSNLSFGPSTPAFNFAGTGSESQIDLTATEVAGSAVVPNLYNSGNGSPEATENGMNSVPDYPVQLIWTPPTDYDTNNSPAFSVITPIGPGYPSVAQLEFPALNESGTVTMGLSATAPGYTGNVTLTDNGNCTNVAGYTPGPTAYQSIASNLSITTYNVGSAEDTCTITATVDNAGAQQAQLNVDYDQTIIPIQSKARAR